MSGFDSHSQTLSKLSEQHMSKVPEAELPKSVSFDPDTLNFDEQYKLLGGSVIPRPIALVTTIGPDGPNAAPFSFFNAIGMKPPMVMFSMSPNTKAIKDTLKNVQANSEFVVHIVSDALKEKMNICAVDYPSSVNEIERAGFRTVPGVKVTPPRIADCPAQFECRLIQILTLGEVPYYVVIGEVVYFHFHSEIVNSRHHIDYVKLDPIGRLSGAGAYTRITDHFKMLIPPLNEAP